MASPQIHDVHFVLIPIHALEALLESLRTGTVAASGGRPVSAKAAVRRTRKDGALAVSRCEPGQDLRECTVGRPDSLRAREGATNSLSLGLRCLHWSWPRCASPALTNGTALRGDSERGDGPLRSAINPSGLGGAVGRCTPPRQGAALCCESPERQ
eukprot:scaffold2621_cov344-Prasinococcus_capsulatus_cf.AAC.4